MSIKKICLLVVFVFSTMHINAWAKLPYYPIQFPRDEAAHYDNVPYPVNFLSEWWYFNGKLTSTKGREFGYYLSYAYGAVDVKGRKVLMPRLEIQIADFANQKVYGNALNLTEKTAKIPTDQLSINYDDNLKLQKIDDHFVADGIVLLRDNHVLEYHLQFTPTRDALLLNGNGLIDETDTGNSYYYSYTHLVTSGYFILDNERFDLTPEKSISWMDHQWGDFILSPLRPWMWASVQLDNGLELCLALANNPKKNIELKWVNVVMPDNSRRYTINDFTYTPHKVPQGEKHPNVYDLSIPSLNLNVQITALSPGQDVNYLWEGMSDVVGTYEGQPIHGQATTENSHSYPK